MVAKWLNARINFEELCSPIPENLPFDFNIICNHIPFFIEGIWTTFHLVVVSLIVGGCLAIPLAVARANKTAFADPIIRGYVYVFRGTPLLVQTYLIYYGLGQFDAVRDSFLWVIFREAYWCALLAFALNTCAYTTEIFRGAIEAMPYGEIEAAKACGMSKLKRMRRIILPSSFRRALPAYSNEVIFMLHSSVIASFITIMDILGAGRLLNNKFYVAYEGLIPAAILYLCITYLIAKVFRQVEKRWYVHLRPRETAAA